MVHKKVACCGWHLAFLSQLNAFDRKQFEKVLDIRYPINITNDILKKTKQNKNKNEGLLSLAISGSRWSLSGYTDKTQIHFFKQGK